MCTGFIKLIIFHFYRTVKANSFIKSFIFSFGRTVEITSFLQLFVFNLGRTAKVTSSNKLFAFTSRRIVQILCRCMFVTQQKFIPQISFKVWGESVFNDIIRKSSRCQHIVIYICFSNCFVLNLFWYISWRVSAKRNSYYKLQRYGTVKQNCMHKNLERQLE